MPESVIQAMMEEKEKANAARQEARPLAVRLEAAQAQLTRITIECERLAHAATTMHANAAAADAKYKERTELKRKAESVLQELQELTCKAEPQDEIQSILSDHEQALADLVADCELREAARAAAAAAVAAGGDAAALLAAAPEAAEDLNHVLARARQVLQRSRARPEQHQCRPGARAAAPAAATTAAATPMDTETEMPLPHGHHQPDAEQQFRAPEQLDMSVRQVLDTGTEEELEAVQAAAAAALLQAKQRRTAATAALNGTPAEAPRKSKHRHGEGSSADGRSRSPRER
jgi:hypothetical protein